MTRVSMKRTPCKASFFRLAEGNSGGIQEFKAAINETYINFQRRTYSNMITVSMDNDKYYIQAMEKVPLEDNLDGENLYYWLVNISRVNLDEEIELADVTKELNDRRRSVEHGENEGLVVDTRILYDPFRKIVVLQNRRGAINAYNLRRFISKFIDVRGIELEIILNADGLNRINQLDIVKSIAYSVAAPDNFRAYRNENRSEFADMRMANTLGGEKMKIIVESTDLTKNTIVDKVKFLLSPSEDRSFVVNALSVDGFYEDGAADSINLIKNKLEFKDDVEHEDVLDDRACFGFLSKAYNVHYDYLKGCYNAVI